MSFPKQLDWSRLRVYPLAERRSLTRIEDVLVRPEAEAPELAPAARVQVEACAADVERARRRGAGVVLMYGAHLLRNGAALVLERMMASGWITHVATNGAGTIHDWEYSWLGRSTESVEQNVAAGTFGAWEETGRWLHVALMAGALRGEGYGASLGRFISEDGTELPQAGELAEEIRRRPEDELTAARADLLRAMRRHCVQGGRVHVDHRWKEGSILAQAWRHGVPATVHPGIGYDIIANHPMFNGAVIGRAAGMDFRLFGDSVETLEGGVLLSVGSAIMAPQVFEKSLSSVNNLRLGAGRETLKDLSIYVVDLQDGGQWDWSKGEPPKSNSAYYLRFCKSFSRMGGRMSYVQCDNMAFVRGVYGALSGTAPLPG